MDQRRTEDLLRERGRRHAAEPLAPGASERLHAVLATRARRRSATWRLLAGAGLATAAAVLLLFLRSFQAERSYGALPVQVALLDADGRQLAAAPQVRGEGTRFRRPREVVIELVPQADGFLYTFVCDPAGHLAAERAQPLSAGADLLWRHPLSGYETVPGEDTYVSLVFVTTARPVGEDRLAGAIPERLDESVDRGTALAALQVTLATRFGCSVTVRDLLLEESEQ